ncbi:MAG: zinc ribbon domain-containing protein [Pseudomonadota bacterium]|nr:zinc ribbon domain-containing protein [Pseudomonadota bacterium]
MPIYQYTCASCGPFSETASISEFDKPCACPACGDMSPRNLLSVPQLSSVNSVARKGHAINERASDNPKLASQTGMKPSGRRIGSKAVHRPDGTRSIAGQRPWLLSH